MKQVGFAPEAIADLEAIGKYIASENPRAAVRFLEALRERCERLGYSPHIGIRRTQFRRDYRSISYRSYVIFYRLEESGVRIERIIHGARDLDAIFHDDES
jgi:toxin ParE1/3/4